MQRRMFVASVGSDAIFFSRRAKPDANLWLMALW
jgi:hypothetical protein